MAKTLREIRINSIRRGTWKGPMEQGEVAKLLRMRQPLLCEVENGKKPIPDKYVFAVSQMWGIDPDQVMRCCKPRARV